MRFPVLIVAANCAFLALSACSDCEIPKERPDDLKDKQEIENPGKQSVGMATKNNSTQLDSVSHPASSSSAPQAYFGKLLLKRQTKPIRVNPIEKSSVVLIVFDALNAKHLGVYGYDRPTSPNIDKLAGRGLVLTDYVSNSSWTRPSFTTIITGLSKSQHGVEAEGGWRLEPEIVTLAERFKKAGYRTAGFTGNPLVRKKWGFDQGFQVYEDSLTLGRKAFFRDSVIIDHAIEWLKKSSTRPFFLVLFMTSSHPPYRPPLNERRFLSELPEGKFIEHPFKEYKEPLPKLDHQRIVAAYDDEIAYMDRQVGRLVAYLNESKKMEQTVIAMTSDHGEIFGEHNCYLHAYHMWEPVLRVPFILTAPNLDVDGVVDDRPYTHVDVVPTLLDLVGIPYQEESLTGVSMVKALANPSEYRERIIFSQYNAHGVRRQAIREGSYKLVHHHKIEERAAKDLDRLHPSVEQPNPQDLPTLAWDRERYEYYDLTKDPRELNNLFKERRKNQELLELMNNLLPYIDNVKQPDHLTEEMIKALENAGYLRRATSK